METKDFVLGYGAGKNSAVSEKIVEEVDAWLDEHITNPDSPPLDRSLASSSAAAPADMVGDISDDVSDVKNTLSHKADLIYDTASGDIATFPDGADGLPVKDLIVGIEPVQDTSGGDPSPTHICPISGWTGCNISHSGADTSDPTVIPITFPSEAGTVYGGTLELPSCVLTVDKGYVEINHVTGKVNQMFGSTDLNDNMYITDATDLQIPSGFTSDTLQVRSVYQINANHYYGFAVSKTSGVIYFLMPEIDGMSQSAANDYISENPFHVVYPLKTPLVYNLDPVTVTTLIGANNIWADCGPSTVEYPCDTKLYIQKINTPTDDDMIADANIASGQYFIANNNLYLSTAAILAGDPIKPGTNCTLTNLAAALNALNS